MTILGIDPGLQGGLVLLSEDRRILEREVMPVVTVAVKRRREGRIVNGSKGTLDRARLRMLLAAWAPGHIILEQAGVRPGESGTSALTIGIGWGILYMAISTYPHETVPPASWTKAMLGGTPATADPKDRARLACASLWPRESFKATDRCRKAHSGLCDAALLAEWGRRRLAGGNVAREVDEIA